MACYVTERKNSSWWFCNKCGVRCFTSRAPSEKLEVDVPLKSLQRLGMADAGASEEMVKTPVWRMKEGFAESPIGKNYFSLNGVTLDPYQEGLDLASWHEKQWIFYVDALENKGDWKTGSPHPWGIY